ncbi:hypothetical protein SNEBB_007884 [Seison nebaliae]|nr:hypothetical protein SNEBB_007884 [Seison nebaliae]
MKIEFDDLTVLFPYDFIYPEQYLYMKELKKCLDQEGHCLLEMPTGTGKTKIIYCSRTIPEMNKVINELKCLFTYYKKMNRPTMIDGKEMLGFILSSRKNLCLHSRVSQMKSGREVDGLCHRLMVNQKIMEETSDDIEDQMENLEVCKFYIDLEKELDERGACGSMESGGVFALEDLKELGEKEGKCPYFMARRMLEDAHIIVYSYSYLLDVKIAQKISIKFPEESVVIFDEAHNIDSVCIDSLSLTLNNRTLEDASKSCEVLTTRLSRMNEKVLKDEYRTILKSIEERKEKRNQNALLANPIRDDDLLMEKIPGNMRNGKHFVQFLKRVIEYIQSRMRAQHDIHESPPLFLRDIGQRMLIERSHLQFAAERLRILMDTLKIEDILNYTALTVVADLCTLTATYVKGFSIIIEPYGGNKKMSNGLLKLDPILTFACHDASIAIKPILKKYRNVAITSGTLSPLNMLPRILDFIPILSCSFTMSLSRQNLCPLVVSKGNDHISMTTKFQTRDDESISRNYGLLLISLCKTVPDGIVAFFTSYSYLESTIASWYEQRVLEQLQKHKLVFIESPDSKATSLALFNYQRACQSGRGALLLSVARGKVSEGVDFDHHYGRCVVMFGVPFVYTKSRTLRARLEFLRERYNIRETDFLTFDAMRHAAQCVGRVLRGKTDYGLMVFADARFGRADKRSRLPKWLGEYMRDGVCDLTIDECIFVAKRYFKMMGKPMTTKNQLGVALLNEDHLKDPELVESLKKKVVVANF